MRTAHWWLGFASGILFGMIAVAPTFADDDRPPATDLSVVPAVGMTHGGDCVSGPMSSSKMATTLPDAPEATLPALRAALDGPIAASACENEPSCHDLCGTPCSVWYQVIPCEVEPEGGCGQCDCFRGVWLCTL